MEDLKEENAQEKLKEFVGDDVFISIHGIIELQVMYEDFNYFINKKRFLISSKQGNEINIDMGSIEKMVANEHKVFIYMDNDQEIILEL